jgi:hypothetical protein
MAMVKDKTLTNSVVVWHPFHADPGPGRHSYFDADPNPDPVSTL